MKKMRILILLLLLALLFTPVLAQVSTHYDLGWHLLSGGGGMRGSAHYQIDDALGQWPDGRTVSEEYQIDPGFWHTGRELPGPRIYMPVVGR